MNISLGVYINARENPFDTEEESKANDNTRVIQLHCNLYLTDNSGTPKWYYSNDNTMLGTWVACDGSFPQGKCVLVFMNSTTDAMGLLPNENILDKWITNSDQTRTDTGYGFSNEAMLEKNSQKGVNIPLWTIGIDMGQIERVPIQGTVFLEITNKCVISNPFIMYGSDPFPADQVTDILINNISISIRNVDKEEISTDDYEFKSYINKKVKADYEGVTLKCISANEEKAPIGKANILRKSDNGYALQLAYTRAGQTDVLERLLMCTIHSNYSQKNEKFSVSTRIAGNPILSHINYSPVLSLEYLVSGCEINFKAGKVNVSAIGYSVDMARLSDIPYD